MHAASAAMAFSSRYCAGGLQIFPSARVMSLAPVQ